MKIFNKKLYQMPSLNVMQMQSITGIMNPSDVRDEHDGLGGGAPARKLYVF